MGGGGGVNEVVVVGPHGGLVVLAVVVDARLVVVVGRTKGKGHQGGETQLESKDLFGGFTRKMVYLFS